MKLMKQQHVNNEPLHWIPAHQYVYDCTGKLSLEQSPGDKKKLCCTEYFHITRVDFHQLHTVWE